MDEPVKSPDTERDNRIPPRQVQTRKWPVLHAGEVPPFDPATWDLTIFPVPLVNAVKRFTWAEFAALFRHTRKAFLDHERAKGELKALMPEDAKEAIGHGVRGQRSKSGAVSFDLLGEEATHAPVQ